LNFELKEISRIAVYGSTELTLPDDSTHHPDSIKRQKLKVYNDV